ncbi:putative glucosyltransferase [Arcticibacter svalbardensis MN12-7]|uniref:Putative glucosyltransferase n=1 Tax=Arcticibacter svalbardensis MN12-7 TaxID=1150600 RepID=R9GPE1_9SPHI|nr:glycosyltransferase family 8 protein [Arcticibacter svalbardensis]EOR93415.1 putative glucosyltransferase [Arcticibacter svalbardensis MN12-7]
MNLNPIHIALAFDDKYITHFFVVITSVFYNNPDNIFHLHIIATGLNLEQKEKIINFVHQHHGEISFYEINATQLQGLTVPENSYLSIAAYYRLFFPLLLPKKINKLLYVDCDLVVHGKLQELYNVNLGTFPFGAVAEVNSTKNRPDLGIYEEGIYFNSGVMLMNIPEWKKQSITEKSIQFIYDYPEKLKYLDQDALNVVAENNYYRIDSRFNVLPNDIPKYIFKREYDQFLKDKVIIHYTLKQTKPWSIFSNHPYKKLYRFYFKKSPQSKDSIFVDVEMTPTFMRRLIRSRKKQIQKKLSQTSSTLVKLHILFNFFLSIIDIY